MQTLKRDGKNNSFPTRNPTSWAASRRLVIRSKNNQALDRTFSFPQSRAGAVVVYTGNGKLSTSLHSTTGTIVDAVAEISLEVDQVSGRVKKL
jgi:hypothetical protein